MLENARTSLEHCLSVNCDGKYFFDTAKRIQIMKMNICKIDLNNNNLKSTCYYKYLIRLLKKSIWFNSVNLQFAPCL